MFAAARPSCLANGPAARTASSLANGPAARTVVLRRAVSSRGPTRRTSGHCSKTNRIPPPPVESHHIYNAHRALHSGRISRFAQRDEPTPSASSTPSEEGRTHDSGPGTGTSTSSDARGPRGAPPAPHPDVIPPTDGSYPSFADSLKRPPEKQYTGMMPGTKTQPVPKSDAAGAPFIDRTWETGQ